MDKQLDIKSNCISFDYCNSILSSMIESTYNAYLVVDLELSIIFCNPNFSKMFDFCSENLLGQNINQIINIISNNIINKSALHSIINSLTIHTDTQTELHKILHMKNSTEVFLTLRPIYENSTIVGFLFNFVKIFPVNSNDDNDFNSELLISLSKNLQARPISESGYLQEINKLKAIQDELWKAKEEAERANLAKSQFLANMSHEIRTPLFGVLGLLNILKKTSLTSEQDKYLDIMHMSAESLMLIINDVLDLAKIESANIELQNTVFDVRDNLCDMLRSVTARAHDKGIEILYEVNEEVPEAIESDLNRLRQVIVNLLTNAVKFSESGEICVNVDIDFNEGEDYTLHFAIKDKGIGIPHDKQNLIFDPFVQIEGSSNRKYGGTGLGLSICKRIVELMNGGIWVESIDGKGSTFHFIIQTRGINSSKNKKDNQAKIDYQLKTLGSYNKVLIFDGNKVSRTIHKKMLESAGFIVKTVDIHRLSLASIKSEAMKAQDFKICVINSPLSGHSFSEICGALDDRKDLRKILLTNSPNKVSDSSKLIHSEVDNFLIKPVKSKELIESIQNIALNKSIKWHNKGCGINISKTPNKVKISKNTPLSDLSLKVLLAEDNEVNQLIISKIMTEEGYTCVITGSGQDAIEKFKEEHFDFIIMDIQMPGMDGFAATRNIRIQEKKTSRHIPIIALSAHALPEHMTKALEAGMDYYLTKPFRYERIQEILDEIKHNIYASLYESSGNFKDSKINNSMFKLLPQTPHKEIQSSTKNKNSFNVDNLFEKLNSDCDFFKVFAEKFIDNTTNLLNEMEQAIIHMDGSQLSKSSHALKGTLSYVDAQKAVSLSIELESRGKDQDLEYADVLLKKLGIEVQSIIEMLIEFIML